MESLRIYFERLIKLSDEEWLDFQACLSKEVIRKKDHILRQNDKCDYIAFIQEGIFRFYTLRDGEKKITAFFFAGEFVTNYRSFLTGKPSEHNIEALQDAVIYKIHSQQLHALYDKYKTIFPSGKPSHIKIYTAGSETHSFRKAKKCFDRDWKNYPYSEDTQKVLFDWIVEKARK